MMGHPRKAELQRNVIARIRKLTQDQLRSVENHLAGVERAERGAALIAPRAQAAQPGHVSAPPAPDRTPVERWTTPRFVALFPGSARRSWHREYVPQLIAAGVLVKNGRGWFGRRSEIEAVLMGSGR